MERYFCPGREIVHVKAVLAAVALCLCDFSAKLQWLVSLMLLFNSDFSQPHKIINLNFLFHWDQTQSHSFPPAFLFLPNSQSDRLKRTLPVHCLSVRRCRGSFLIQGRQEYNQASELTKHDNKLLPWMFSCTVSVLPWARFCPKCLFVQPCCWLHPWESMPSILSFPFSFCFVIQSSVCRYLYKEHLCKTHLVYYFEGELYSIQNGCKQLLKGSHGLIIT